VEGETTEHHNIHQYSPKNKKKKTTPPRVERNRFGTPRPRAAAAAIVAERLLATSASRGRPPKELKTIFKTGQAARTRDGRGTTCRPQAPESWGDSKAACGWRFSRSRSGAGRGRVREPPGVGGHVPGGGQARRCGCRGGRWCRVVSGWTRSTGGGEIGGNRGRGAVIRRRRRGGRSG